MVCFVVTTLVLFHAIQAVKLGDSDPSRYVAGYVWLIHGWYKQHWWTAEVAKDDVVDCTNEELEDLVKRSIAILQIPSADNFTSPTDVQLVRSQVLLIHTCTSHAKFVDVHMYVQNSRKCFNVHCLCYHRLLLSSEICMKRN